MDSLKVARSHGVFDTIKVNWTQMAAEREMLTENAV
jgi:hypothetical protein